MVEVRGRVLDPDGKLVAGAKLYLSSREKEATYPLRATSGGDGRFTFRSPLSGSPGRDSAAQALPLKVLAVAKGYGCAWESVGSGGKELTLRLVKDAVVSGRIVDADSLGGSWWDSGFEEDTDAMLRWGKTVTDKEGRYELLGLAKPINHKLGVKPPKGQLYFKQVVGLGDTPGLAALVADIDMVQGVTVQGKVTDKTTNKPIAGARVFYGPIDNPNDSSGAVSSEATTEPDGSYALTVQPGPGVLAVVCPNPGAYMHALVTTKEQKEFFTAQFRFGNDTWLGMSTGGHFSNPTTTLWCCWSLRKVTRRW